MGVNVTLKMAASSSQDAMALKRFDKILSSNQVIKSQQRGDPELTKEEKSSILSNMLLSSPGSFLRRFGSLLDLEDLTYFVTSTDYEVQYRTKELKRLLNGNNRQKRTNNRRYKAIEELTRNSDYFSEQEMKERCPLLYEQYIGKFLSDEERDKLGRCQPGELSLAAHIANKLDNDIMTEKLVKELRIERNMESTGTHNNDSRVLTVSDDPQTAEQDKYILRKEFLRLMHLRFLNGEEEDYDYSTVDNNEEYDVHTIGQRDDEESYFDSEEPSNKLDEEENMEHELHDDDGYDY